MNILAICQKVLQKGVLYKLQDNAALLKVEDYEDITQLAQVQRVLTEAGYECCDEWQENGSAFCGYVKENEQVWVSCHEKSRTLRLISDVNSALPEKKTDEKSSLICNPMLTQGRMMYYGCNCGMLYLIRLGDSRFAVIDGGLCEYEEVDYFLELLRAQNVREGKPRIAAWFITHPHADHTDLFAEVMLKHRDEIELDALVYSWADPVYASDDKGRPITEYTYAVKNCCQGVDIIQPHTGQRFCYEGVTFHVLYTHEDACPTYLNYCNDTSLVMRMDVAQAPGVEPHRAMFLGDALGGSARIISGQYAPETLKSDILQVAHHGYGGGSTELYAAMDPETVLWPAPDYMYQTVKQWESNLILGSSPNIKRMALGGNQEVVLDFGKPVSFEDPFAVTDQAKAGDVLYEEDFVGKRVFDLGWDCLYMVCADKEGAIKLTMGEGNCRMEAGSHCSMCQIVLPGLLRSASDWTLTLKGFVNAFTGVCSSEEGEEVSQMSLFLNWKWPAKWAETEAMRLPLVPGEVFVLRLEVRAEAGGVRLFSHGEQILEENFSSIPETAIYLALQNVDITMEHICVVKN